MTDKSERLSARICHEHGDTFGACKGLPHRNRALWCDGQGTAPKYRGSYGWGVCSACEKMVRLRSNGTIRAHNGRGK